MKQEQERLLNYEKATINVRFVQNKCDNETNDPSSANADDDESDKSFLEVLKLFVFFTLVRCWLSHHSESSSWFLILISLFLSHTGW